MTTNLAQESSKGKVVFDGMDYKVVFSQTCSFCGRFVVVDEWMVVMEEDTLEDLDPNIGKPKVVITEGGTCSKHGRIWLPIVSLEHKTGEQASKGVMYSKGMKRFKRCRANIGGEGDLDT